LPAAISDLQSVKIGSVKLFSRWLGRSLNVTPRNFSRMASDVAPQNGTAAPAAAPKKLQGREFYESIGSPKYIVAPMVDRSEFVSSFQFPQIPSAPRLTLDNFTRHGACSLDPSCPQTSRNLSSHTLQCSMQGCSANKRNCERNTSSPLAKRTAT
jgi:hypothetical protein